ncbi:MAG: Trk system potassium transporter TrkA [Prevotella sp.]|nr:Trk system potassium transporter TrkA [Prevotella sp.]
MNIIIVGAYAIGTHLAKLLSRSNNDTVLIDDSEVRLASVSGDYDLMTYLASPASFKTLKEAGVSNADLFIAVTPDHFLNITCCMMAHSLGAKKTVAKVDENEYLDESHQAFFNEVGIDSLIYPEHLAAIDICNGLKMSWVRQRWDVHNSALVMLGIKMRETAEILNQPLKDLSKPDTPYHVVAVKRGDDTIIPRGDDVLKLHDMVYFMTKRDTIPYVRKIVGKEHYVDVKNVMIMGGGNTAVRAIGLLPEYMNAKIIEMDEARCEELNELIDNDRVMIINGDGRDLSLLRDEGIGNTQAFVALTSNAETNILACLTAKRMGVRKTVAVVENMDYVSMAESLDIGTIINKKALAASRIYQMMLDEDVTVSNIKFLTTANADVAEFTAQQGSKVTRKKVFELGLPNGVTIGGLVRNGVGQLVSGGTQIEAGDNVVVFCHNINMSKIEKFFK